MKVVKGFVKTCYSEELLANLIESEKDPAKPDSPSDTMSDSAYLGGLGLRFKFPGDPRK